MRARRHRPMCAATMTPARAGAGARRAILRRWWPSDAFSGVVLVARAGEPVYEKAFGLADRERKTPNTRRHALQHRLDQQDLHEDRRGAAGVAGQAEAVRHARRAAAGLPASRRRRRRPWTSCSRIRPASRTSSAPPSSRRPRISSGRMPTTIGWSPRCRRCLRRAPGARYCNGCYIVLGAIIAKVTGMPYEDYIAAHVYAPAGMTTGRADRQATRPSATRGGRRRRRAASAATRACTACPEALPAAGTPRRATC